MEDASTPLKRPGDVPPKVEQPATPHPGGFIARVRGRPLLPLLAFLTIIFFGLTFLVVGANLGPTFIDVQLTLAVQLLPEVPVGFLLELVSWPGFNPQSLVILGLIIAFMLWQRWIVEAVFTAIADAGGLVTGIVKLLVDRPRPSPDLVRVARELETRSFPSGHVTEYVVLYGFLFYLTYTLLPRRSPFRLPLLILFGVLIVLVGPSRVYMGQHWSSDALAGYALGFAYLLIVIEAYRAWQRRKQSQGSGLEGQERQTTEDRRRTTDDT